MPYQRSKQIVFILFGRVKYDGRARRLLNLLQQLAQVELIEYGKANIPNPCCDSRSAINKIIYRFNSGRIMPHITLAVKSLVSVIKAQPDMIVAANYFTIMTSWIVARCIGAKLVYDAYELIIPENSVKVTKRTWFWYLCERTVIKSVDVVIAANQERAEIMAAHYRLTQAPTWIRNIPVKQSVDVYQSDRKGLKEEIRRTDRDRIVVYQGDISIDRGLDRFIYMLNYLPREYRLVIVGDGPDRKRLEALARAYKTEGRFLAMGRVAYAEMPMITCLADVGIVTYSFSGLNNIYCASNKIFEYAQAGVPVVATSQPPLRKLVDKFGIGELVDERATGNEVAEKIRTVVENRDSYTIGLEEMLSKHSYAHDAERVKRILAMLFNS